MSALCILPLCSFYLRTFLPFYLLSGFFCPIIRFPLCAKPKKVGLIFTAAGCCELFSAFICLFLLFGLYLHKQIEDYV